MLKKLVLILLSLAFALGLAEVALRLAHYRPLHAVGNGGELVIRPSAAPGVLYDLTPLARTQAWDVDVQINAQGLRGASGEPGPYRGTRVLVLGDSIAFGNYLRVEDTFASQLAEILRPAGDFQVLNFAVPGYDILQELAVLEAKGLNYQPDVVVLQFCLNDAGHVSPNLALARVIASRQRNPVYRLRLASFVSDRLELGRQERWIQERNDPAAFETANAGRIDPVGEDETQLREWMAEVPNAHPARWYSWPERVGRIRYALRRLSELAREHGFSPVVVVFPWLVEEEGQYPFETVHRIVAHEVARAGIAAVDLTAPFLEIGLKALRVIGGDAVHPDRRGHAIAARQLADWILDEKRGDLGPSPR